MSQNSEIHLSLTILFLAILLWISHAAYSIYVLFFDDALEPSSISQMFSH
jgi:uncharacterized membrane protein